VTGEAAHPGRRERIRAHSQSHGDRQIIRLVVALLAALAVSVVGVVTQQQSQQVSSALKQGVTTQNDRSQINDPYYGTDLWGASIRGLLM
jgi:hypothetical protein